MSLAASVIQTIAVGFRLLELVFQFVRRPKDTLLKYTDRRGGTLWIGDAPRLLKIPMVKEGQIIFGAGSGATYVNTKSGFVRKLIAYASSGPYTHCGIVFKDANGELFVYEAAPHSGVGRSKLHEFVDRYKYVSIFNEPAFTKSGLRKSKNFAKYSVKKKLPYAWSRALILPITEMHHQARHWLPSSNAKLINQERTKSIKTNYFCSEFVLDCLKASKIPGFESAYYDSSKWSPMMLAEENGLFKFHGYIVPRGYLDVSLNDPILSGHGHFLGRWEKARLSNDVAVLNAFSISMRRDIMNHSMPANQFLKLNGDAK